jgi:pyridoxal phosphate enzyme (YggS family)
MPIRPQNSSSIESLDANLRQLRARIAAAAAAAGRNEAQVTLVAVGKGQSTERLRGAAQLGLTHFAENYLQESLPKLEALAGMELTWHFIGRVQANKTRVIAEHFQWVHGIDRLRIAERLSAQRPHCSPALNVLLQVNIGQDEAKAGVEPAAVPKLVEAVAALPRLRLRGFMCMLPEGLESSARRAAFASLRQLLETCNARGAHLDALSMGMSGDFEDAVLEGATHVRIGTALFGARD